MGMLAAAPPGRAGAPVPPLLLVGESAGAEAEDLCAAACAGPGGYTRNDDPPDLDGYGGMVGGAADEPRFVSHVALSDASRGRAKAQCERGLRNVVWIVSADSWSAVPPGVRSACVYVRTRPRRHGHGQAQAQAPVREAFRSGLRSAFGAGAGAGARLVDFVESARGAVHACLSKGTPYSDMISDVREVLGEVLADPREPLRLARDLDADVALCRKPLMITQVFERALVGALVAVQRGGGGALCSSSSLPSPSVWHSPPPPPLAQLLPEAEDW